MSGLAFIHINYDKNIDVTRVLQIFSKKPRALQFTNICLVNNLLTFVQYR